MKKIIFIYTFLVATMLFAQQDIEVSSKQNNNEYVITVKNNTFFRQKVSLYIKGSGYQSISSPITKLVNKGETIDFVSLKPTGKQNFIFTYNYDYESNATAEERATFDKQLENKRITKNLDLSKGLYVFTKDNCTRSERTLNYLLKNNTDFKTANTTNDAEMNNLMWRKLNTIGIKKDIIMPVIIYNGKITYSHKDLDGFLKTLH